MVVAGRKGRKVQEWPLGTVSEGVFEPGEKGRLALKLAFGIFGRLRAFVDLDLLCCFCLSLRVSLFSHGWGFYIRGVIHELYFINSVNNINDAKNDFSCAY